MLLSFSRRRLNGCISLTHIRRNPSNLHFRHISYFSANHPQKMDPNQSTVPSKRPVETETCSTDPTPEPKRSRADSEAHTPLSDAQPQPETAPEPTHNLPIPASSSTLLENADASASIAPQSNSDATPAPPQLSTDVNATKGKDGSKDKKRNDSRNQEHGKGGRKADKKKDKKAGQDSTNGSWSRRGTRKEGEARPEGEEKAPRLPKRQCALLIGFCGTGCNGMQMYVPTFSFVILCIFGKLICETSFLFSYSQPDVRTIEGVLFDALVRAGAVSKDNADDPVKVSPVLVSW